MFSLLIELGSTSSSTKRIQDMALYSMGNNISFATFRYLQRYNLLPDNLKMNCIEGTNFRLFFMASFVTEFLKMWFLQSFLGMTSCLRRLTVELCCRTEVLSESPSVMDFMESSSLTVDSVGRDRPTRTPTGTGTRVPVGRTSIFTASLNHRAQRSNRQKYAIRGT